MEKENDLESRTLAITEKREAANIGFEDRKLKMEEETHAMMLKYAAEGLVIIRQVADVYIASEKTGGSKPTLVK